MSDPPSKRVADLMQHSWASARYAGHCDVRLDLAVAAVVSAEAEAAEAWEAALAAVLSDKAVDTARARMQGQTGVWVSEESARVVLTQVVRSIRSEGT